APAMHLPAQPAPALAAAPSAPAADAAPAAPPKSSLVEIKSPMVGTFYRSPAPEAPSYVEPGSRVAKGQTLCILEAMKLMNELPADVNGTIREICVESGEPVEYGQVLFRVEPA
ncbi:MAG TPA: acetyl-CoA carboxylase biotin carboxyl carrier protein, partial [Longimicrobium sp.]|nr:acetyl-CoA carboxylase biotin carboxyl carrier protein [Longimicrobium sp.]